MGFKRGVKVISDAKLGYSSKGVKKTSTVVLSSLLVSSMCMGVTSSIFALDTNNKSDVVSLVSTESGLSIRQSIGVINAMAEPETTDGMKLPTISFANEQNVKFPWKWGGFNGDASNEIKGDLYVKYGNPRVETTGVAGAYMHTYGSATQEQYNKVVNYVKTSLQSISFRLQPEWVYMQHYLNGGKSDSFVDPILSQNGIKTTYGQWKSVNAEVIKGVSSGKLTKANAETLAMYSSAISHIESKISATSLGQANGWKAWSAYHVIFEGMKDSDSLGQLRLLVADVLGLNAMLAGHNSSGDFSATTLNVQINVGNYWWTNAKSILLKSNTTVPLVRHENPNIHINVVYEVPTVDSLW